MTRVPVMRGRTLHFVNHGADAPAPLPDVDIVVLDTAWTAPPGGRADVRPVRPVVWSIIERRNVYEESLAALDEWAERTGLADRLALGGASWWFHIRGFLRLDLHELVIWRHVLEALAPPGTYTRLEIPEDRPRLLDAALADHRPGRAEVRATPPTTTSRRFGSGRPSSDAGTPQRGRLRRLAVRAWRLAIRVLLIGALRNNQLERRLRDLAARKVDALAVVRGESFHVIAGGEGDQRGDPYVSPVLSALEGRGRPTAVALLGKGHGDPWTALRDDPRAIPMQLLTVRFRALRRALAEPDPLEPRLRDVELEPLEVAGGDLAPILARILRSLDGWFDHQRRDLIAAEELLTALRPASLLTGWEASRTAWLEAARRCGVPSVAIQHGVIYRNNPDYYRPESPKLVRPTLTCVFGEEERDLLVNECGYPPGDVIATGSPRIAPEGADIPATPDERDAVRREIGVLDAERMLVISGARHSVGEELHGVTILGRLFDGPLPGVHLVFKLHPEESGGEHYIELVEGLATAGGFAAPPVSIVRDMDLYRLLRAADAHLGIYSTVLTDAVLTATPNMVAVGQAWSDLLGYVPAGVAQPVRDVGDVRAFMQQPRPPSDEARRRFLRRHFAPGDAGARIADEITGLAARTGTRIRPQGPPDGAERAAMAADRGSHAQDLVSAGRGRAAGVARPGIEAGPRQPITPGS